MSKITQLFFAVVITICACDAYRAKVEQIEQKACTLGYVLHYTGESVWIGDIQITRTGENTAEAVDSWEPANYVDFTFDHEYYNSENFKYVEINYRDTPLFPFQPTPMCVQLEPRFFADQ